MIEREEIKRIAQLSMLELGELELGKMTLEMGKILDYVEELSELDLEDVEPTSYAVDLFNIYREDELGTSLNREGAIQNAPQTDGIHFLVPRVIEEEESP